MPNPVQRRDAEVLLGILAILEGAIWAGSLDGRTTNQVAVRFAEQGLLAAGHDQRDLRQAIGDMNQRSAVPPANTAAHRRRPRSRHEVTAGARPAAGVAFHDPSGFAVPQHPKP